MENEVPQVEKKQFNPFLIVLALLLVVGVIAFPKLLGNKPASSAPSPEASTEVEQVIPLDGEIKEFTVEGGNFKFDKETITVSKGDTVKVTFKNNEGMHDFVLDEFNVRTKIIEGGAEEVVTFVADKEGTFEYYCSVGKHREMGMKGRFIVE